MLWGIHGGPLWLMILNKQILLHPVLWTMLHKQQVPASGFSHYINVLIIYPSKLCQKDKRGYTINLIYPTSTMSNNFCRSHTCTVSVANFMAEHVCVKSALYPWSIESNTHVEASSLMCVQAGPMIQVSMVIHLCISRNGHAKQSLCTTPHSQQYTSTGLWRAANNRIVLKHQPYHPALL